MVAITNNVYTLVNRKSNGDTNVVLDIYQGVHLSICVPFLPWLISFY